MIIRTRDYVNDRTADGRVYSAGGGATSFIDDDDEGMVALMRSLAARGLVDIEGESDEESPAIDETALTDETAPTETAPKRPARAKTVGGGQ